MNPPPLSRLVPIRIGWAAALCLVHLASALVVHEAIALDQRVPVVPAEVWTLPSGTEVKLTEKEGVLIVDYTVDVKEFHQVGNYSYRTGSFDLLLKTPVPLPEDADRVLFEAIGSEWKSWNSRDNQVRLRPLVRDASGEVHLYSPFFFEPLTAPRQVGGKRPDDGTRWRRLVTRQFYTSEAGGATQDIFESQGGDRNSWPDGPLTFIGFSVEVRKPKFGPFSGQVVLGSCNILGGPLDREDPWLYADALCEKSGSYKLGYEASVGFQAKPLIGNSSTLDYDSKSLASSKQHVSFALGGDNNYWISYRLVDGNGKIAASDFLRYDVYDRKNAPKLSGVDLSTPPPSGLLRVNPDRHSEGIYESGEPLTVTARVFPSASKGLTLRWELMPYNFPEILETGDQPVTLEGREFQDIQFTLAGKKGRDAYRLRVKLMAGKSAIDEVVYHLGRKTVFTEPSGKVTNNLCDRDKLKAASYNRVTVVPLSSARFKTEDERLKYFEDRLDQIVKITPNVTYNVDLQDLEPLPGVYNFQFTDRLLDAAAKRGMAVTLRLDHVDDYGHFTWLKYSRQHNYDGTEIPEHFYGGFCSADKVYAQAWHDALYSIYRRYGDHPAFQGYYLLQPAGEFTVSDKPWEGIIAGYEPPMRSGFRDYLRENLGLDIAALNARWKTNFASWDEVTVPQPELKTGSMPDLRMQWVDFCNFKHWLDGQFWFGEAAGRIRKYDPHHVIISYGHQFEAMKGLVDFGHNGGNHYAKLEGELVGPAEKFNSGWITEPHHPQRWAAYGDPEERGWVLDWSVWIMIAQAGGKGANLHIYYDPTTLALGNMYGGSRAYDRMQKFYPILQELHGIKLAVSPASVAVNQDLYTLYCKHRTTFFQRPDDLMRWFELLKFDNVNFEVLKPERLAEYKLVLPNLIDEVTSLKTIEHYEDAVRNHGAKMIISANTGSYCPELGKDRFALLRKLGIETPKGNYIQQERGVQAQVIQDGPLFAKGTPVKFFTLADFQADLQSENVREKFWAYPYRWIPQTDYFGYYRDNPATNGEVLARFASGAPAVSRHAVGKGEVVVLWGTPDWRTSSLGGLMSKAATWAGVNNPLAANPIPLMREADHPELGRHYALIFEEKPGTYAQRLASLPDGDWFVDDMVSGERLGRISGAQSKKDGVALTFSMTTSPLKILRFIKIPEMKADWTSKYPEAAAVSTKGTQ